MSETPEPQPDVPTTRDLESLVGEWLTVPDVAERLGVPLSQVRQLIADREVLAARIGERRVIAIPAKFFDETGPRPELRGTFTVLADGGMDDDEIIEWLLHAGRDAARRGRAHRRHAGRAQDRDPAPRAGARLLRPA